MLWLILRRSIVGFAKKIRVVPILAADANRMVKAIHYSGKIVQNSQVHLGVFLDGKCGGAMQFGPSTDKRKLQSLVRDTRWNGFIELNRMAFADWLPRNSESRALSQAFRIIKRGYPSLEWIVSFADGCQCGDGAIYRACGFVLTGIKNNSSLYRFPDGEVVSSLGIKTGFNWQLKKFGRVVRGESAVRLAKQMGAVRLDGFQLRYVYFLNPAARNRLTVPVIPFSEIRRRGALMYKGVRSADSGTSGDQSGGGGASPTRTLS